MTCSNTVVVCHMIGNTFLNWSCAVCGRIGTDYPEFGYPHIHMTPAEMNSYHLDFEYDHPIPISDLIVEQQVSDNPDPVDYYSYPLRRELVDRIHEHEDRHPDCDIDRLINDAVWHAIEEHERVMRPVRSTE